MKKTIKEVEQKAKTWENNRHILDNVVALACTKFVDAGIIGEIFTEAKVIQLGEIIEDLYKKVAELEA